MWKREKTKRLIKEVVKKYGKEIAIEGSNAVLGLEEHLDRIVAELMGVELEIIKIVRQWRAVIERAAITDRFDSVRILIESEEEKRMSQTEEEIKTEEIEMKTEEKEQTISSSLVYPQEQLALSKLDSEIASTSKNSNSILEEIEDIKVNEEIGSTKHSEENSQNEEQVENEISQEVHEAASLDQSIWAPKKESCVNQKDIETKIAAINVLSDNIKQREKSLR